MSEAAAEASAIGRPSGGQTLVQDLAEAAARRPRSRNIGALRRLAPFIADHWGDAALSALFLLVSSGATLGITGGVRLLVDHLTGPQATPAGVDRWFLLLGAIALTLGFATAGRYFFVTKLGERVVADLRKVVYRHILGLDPAFFLHTRTGEVLSRLTTDIQIVETLVSTSVSVALRNLVMLVGALALMLAVSLRLTAEALLLIPIVIVPLFLFGRRVRRLTTTTQDQFAEAVGYDIAEEGIRYLQAINFKDRDRTVSIAAE